MNSFYLSSHGIRNIHFNCYERDFTFIVCDKQFACSNFIADFLSPNVSNLRLTDSTISSYTVCEECLFDPDEFSFVISLGEGNSIEMNEINRTHLIHFFRALGNREVLSYLVNDEEQIDVSNAINIFMQRFAAGYSLDKIARFISLNFNEFDFSELDKLDAEEIGLILSSPDIIIEDEDTLFNFVIHLVSKNKELYFPFFEFVNFSYLSKDSISTFLKMFSFNEMNDGIWNSLCQRLLCDVKGLNLGVFGNKKALIINGDDLVEWKGIFYKLTKINHGNLNELNIVKVTSSGMMFNSPPQNVLDFKSPNYYYSTDVEESWIEFEFVNFFVFPIAYSIKTTKLGGKNWSHLRNWVVIGTDEKGESIEIDQRRNENCLNGSEYSHTFKIDKQIKCRKFRIQQKNKNWAKLNFLVVSAIEIYGKCS